MQLLMLRGARQNPELMALLRQSYSQVQPLDQASIDNEANAAKSKYMSGTVAPELARLIASDGGNASSFAAARQAAMAQQGTAQADGIFAQAREAAQARALATRQQQMQEEDRAWGQLNDDGYFADPSQDYSRMVGSSASGRLAANAQNKEDRLGQYIEGGASALNYLGRQYTQAKQQGVNPFGKLANSIGSVARDIIGAPKAMASGFNSGYSGSPLGTPNAGGFAAMVPGANGYGGYDTRRF